MFHTRLVRAQVWFYLCGVVHSHFFGKWPALAVVPLCAPFNYQTWRAKQMHWQRVRWELRHHVQSFHGVRDSRDGLNALLRRYYSKTKEWSMADRTDLIMRHACHVAAWIAFGEFAVEWAGKWALANQCFQGEGSFPEQTDSRGLRWNWLNKFWLTRISNQTDGIAIVQCADFPRDGSNGNGFQFTR